MIPTLHGCFHFKAVLKHALLVVLTECMMASCSSRLKGESTTRDPNWLELPRDVTANILHRLDILEIVRSARRVCSEWRNIFKDPLMWHSIDMSFHYSLWGDYLVDICRYAVGQSDGRVENIDIDDFATDDLLKYIANR